MSDKKHDKGAEPPRKSLSDDEVVTRRRMNRRSLLGLAGAGAVGAAAFVATGRPAQAQVTDSDGGPFADPAGNGRGGVRTGLTDSDGGQWADPPGGGRWGSGLTDSDNGPITDPAGNGRRGW